MKILVIAPTPFFADRGTHIRILEEALALEKIGHKITIATYHIGKDIDSSVQTRIDLRRIRRLLFWYKKLEAGPDWQKILLDIMLIRKAFYLARTQKPDILHCHLHEGILIGWIVKKCLFWRKMKLVADFHGSLTKEMVSHSYLSGGLLKSIFKRVEWKIDNLGDAAIASSWELTEEIKKIRKRGDVEIILDGVNISHYEKLPTKEFLKKELELPLNKVIVTYTGALIINKGISYFLDSIPKVIEKNKEVFFVIAGFPIEGTEKYIKEKKLENFVRIISPLSYFELPKILMASDLAIDPKDSSTNQASGKILQYMAAGLPVVCFNRENNRKYLEDGAFYAKNISASDLAETIIQAITEKEEIDFKGIKNKERAKIFSWEKSAEKISKLYEKIS
jgi:glycosyltransferase involved in cell wall biosynthesis